MANHIDAISWGKVTVGGKTFKDVRIGPTSGPAEWNWNLTGTRHTPGTQIADVADLVAEGAEVVVISRGMDLVLQCMPETIKYLQDRGIESVVEQTKIAVEKYNQILSAGRRVGGVFHSTC